MPYWLVDLAEACFGTEKSNKTNETAAADIAVKLTGHWSALFPVAEPGE